MKSCMMIPKTRDIFDVFDYGFGLPRLKSLQLDNDIVSDRFSVDETSNKLAISIDVPGVKTEDINIELEGNLVSVTYKLKNTKYKSSYSISKKYDAASAKVFHELGVLTIEFDVSEKQQIRKLEISKR